MTKIIKKENEIKCIDCQYCYDFDKDHKTTNNQYILGSCKHKKEKVLINRIDKNCQLSKRK